MIAAWMAYALMVSVLTAGTALVLEALLRSHKKAVRGVWFGAMAFTFLWPLWTALPPVARSPVSMEGEIPVLAMDPLSFNVGSQSAWHALETPLIMAWIGGSLLLTLLVSVVLLRTRRLRGRWQAREMGGRQVLISDGLGPAVVGIFNPSIVLPRWCANLEPGDLELILEHEAEHLRAGDLRLLILAGLPPILLPWSLPLWWMWHRLRLAVEGDCDLRVLRNNPRATRAYMELLLEVGRRVPESRLAAAMLSEPERTLERRIKIMTMPIPKKPLIRGAVLVTAGVILVAVACLAPSPTAVDDEARLPAVEAVAQEALLSEGPTFTPYTIRPDIKNRAEVARAMEENYPPLLRDAGIGGTITVWFFLDKTGTVQKVQVNESSGHEALDDAALRVAEAVEFTAALNRDEPVPVWISLPITFTVGSGGESTARVPVRNPSEGAPFAGRSTPAEAPVQGGSLSDAPTFTPYTVRPDIKNRAEVARAMEENYPPLLRDAGIGGTITVWFFLDKTGTVQKVQVNESSGHEALDDAALRVGEQIEFTPALNREDPVPVWISLPITFTTR